MDDIFTVGDLIAVLQRFHRDAPVAIAGGGPRTYFEYAIADAVQIEEDEEGPGTVYIGEGAQRRYLPGSAREEFCW